MRGTRAGCAFPASQCFAFPASQCFAERGAWAWKLVYPARVRWRGSCCEFAVNVHNRQATVQLRVERKASAEGVVLAKPAPRFARHHI
jgi:hypothetical protein